MLSKRIISILLVAAFVVGLFAMMTGADTGRSGIAEKGEYTYTMSADPDTGTVPDGFGTVTNNGRIWTDKSVSVDDDNDVFKVDLQVLAQEYISSYGSAETTSIAADVVMILDFTGSMVTNSVSKEDGSSVTRLEALVDSANEAIDIITSTNENNRISVYAFYGSGNNMTCVNIMPLAHYTSSSTSTDTTDKYMVYSSSSSGGSSGPGGGGNSATVSSSSTLLKDGASFSFSQSTGTGTCTQYGIASGVSGLVSDINSETDNSIERKPYVILMTDGEPTVSSKNWYSTTISDLTSNTVSGNGGGGGQSGTGDTATIIPAATILTAAIWRDRLEDAYTNYNGKNMGLEWFNIGLGVSDDPTDATSCLVNPEYLVDVTGSNASGANEAQKVKYYLSYSDYAPAYSAKDYSADENYVYPNREDGYVTFADTYEVLSDAFVTLANIIKEGTQTYTIPIVNHEGSGESNSDVVFTDVIGEGMFITDITLYPNGAAPVVGVDDGNGTYTFSGYETTATVTEDANGQQTLVWSLPAKEVAMFTFADREDVTNGEYVSAEPTRLSVTVDISEEVEEGPAYTNAYDGDTPLTTVTYEIPGDNQYYYDVVTDQFSNFVSSTIKTGLDSSTAKTENTTETASTSHTDSYTARNDGTENSSAVANGTLGNNGKVTFLSRKENVEITIEKIWEDAYGNVIDNTAGLPEVTINLYREADNGGEEELYQALTMSNSNDYSETLTVAIRDERGERYTYYVKEDSPDGYYIANISSPLRARDGTLSVTNREMPDSGVVVVQKKWTNKIGAEIIDKTSLPPIDITLKRHVTAVTTDTYNVTVTMTGNAGRGTTYTFPVQTVDAGSTISFTVRAYIRRQNTASSATISLNGSMVTSSASQEYYYTDPVNETGRISTNRFWCRETETQTFTVTSDLNLDYICSAELNTSTITGYDPCQLLNISVTPPATPIGGETYYDEDYASATLNNGNSWQAPFSDLPLTETIGDTSYTYLYYVEETSDIEGYTVSYSDNNTAGVEGGVLTVTNKSDSAIQPLPTTGGSGNNRNLNIFGAALSTVALVSLGVMAIPQIRKRKRKFLISL